MLSERIASIVEFGWNVGLAGHTMVEGGDWTAWPVAAGKPTRYRPPVVSPIFEGEPAPHPEVLDKRFYEPMRVAGLHRIFAVTKETSEGVLGFVNQYGLLGRYYAERRKVGEDGNPVDEHEQIFDSWEPCGEPLSEIAFEIRKMRGMIFLLEQARERGFDAPLRPVHKEVQSIFLGDPPAKLCQKIYFKEHGSVGGLLEHFIDWQLSEGVSSTFTIETLGRLGYRPKDLLGAMHLQLAMEISDQKGLLQQCPVCHTWFEQQHRKQIYCEDRCKTKAYRKRRSEETERAVAGIMLKAD